MAHVVEVFQIQTITWNNDDLLSTWLSGTHFSYLKLKYRSFDSRTYTENVVCELFPDLLDLSGQLLASDPQNYYSQIEWISRAQDMI